MATSAATAPKTRRRLLIDALRTMCRSVHGGRYHVHRGAAHLGLCERHRFAATLMGPDSPLSEIDTRKDEQDRQDRSTIVLDLFMALRGTPDELEDDFLDQMRADAVAVLRSLPTAMRSQHGIDIAIDYPNVRSAEVSMNDYGFQAVSVTFTVTH